jgi:GDP-4-dehydro-6-deoxy-D-mannose reductase
MASKKILITGGTGFVGNHLVALLRQLEPQARLHLTSLTAEPAQAPVQIHALDLTQATALTELITKLQPTEIYHLASLANVGDSFAQPEQVIDNNFRLTLNLLATLRQLKRPPRLLLISSSEIYAWQKDQALDETAVIKPTSPYAASKAIQDALGQSYSASYQLPIIIARPFNHIGPGQRQGFVVADFAAKIAAAEKSKAKPVIKVGNLNSYRDFTDVRDMVRAYHLLMTRGKVGEIYNIGSGQTIKIAVLLEKMLALAIKPIRYEVDPKNLRPTDVPKVMVNLSKIARLGWRPQIILSQTLADTLEYWRGII